MVYRKKFIAQFTFFVLFLFIPVFAGAVNFTQTITLEKDGSGIIKLIYSEKETTVKAGNFVVGSLPFSKEKSEEYFNSSNTSIRIFTVEKDPKDNSLLQVIVAMNFKDLNRINEMKALSNAQVSLTKTDSGNVFKYFITPAFTKANFLESVYTILIYNGKFKSSNGDAVANGSITWYRGKEFLNIKDIYLFATIESEVKTETNTTGEKGKSCGLFGFELPILLIAGLAFNFTKKVSRIKK